MFHCYVRQIGGGWGFGFLNLALRMIGNDRQIFWPSHIDYCIARSGKGVTFLWMTFFSPVFGGSHVQDCRHGLLKCTMQDRTGRTAYGISHCRILGTVPYFYTPFTWQGPPRHHTIGPSSRLDARWFMETCWEALVSAWWVVWVDHSVWDENWDWEIVIYGKGRDGNKHGSLMLRRDR